MSDRVALLLQTLELLEDSMVGNPLHKMVQALQGRPIDEVVTIMQAALRGSSARCLATAEGNLHIIIPLTPETTEGQPS